MVLRDRIKDVLRLFITIVSVLSRVLQIGLTKVGGKFDKALLILYAVVVLGFAFLIPFIVKPSSSLNYLPLIVGPIIGLLWIVFYLREIFELSSEYPIRKRYGRTYFVIYLFFGYILLACTFSAGYFTLGKLDKGQVAVVKNNYEPTDKVRDIIYYSFVTASTLGYGDLIPLGKARILACTEVVMFLMYLGVGLLYVQEGYRGVTPTKKFLEESLELEE